MVIKEGYKQTEIGVIPNDWEVKSFKDVSYMNGRIGWQVLNQTEFTMNSNEPFLITGMNFKNGAIRWNEVYHISEDRFEIAKDIQLKDDDVLMTKDGTIGKLLYVENIPYPHKASLNSHLLVFRPLKNLYNPKYLYYNLLSPYFFKHIELTKSGTTFFGISQTSVGEYNIILPPLAEQTAIANALSDADGLITGLEKLIAKKRNIKQGAMQQLLQPKDGWEVKKLGEIFTITAGGDLDVNNFSLITDEKYCYPIYSNALTNKGLYGFTSEYRQIENTITVTARGQVGVANPRDHKYTAIGRVIMLNPIIELNINFITECINNFIKFNNESTGVPQLTAPQISKYEIIIPDYKEQTQIAKILSDMDAEISSLEQKLEKYKKVKLGMMQELLTGKTRLN